jgi:putative peptide zinc metalloprotease protein
MLAILGVLFVSGVFHEFGHAAALRYGGGQVRGMGAGFYLVCPALYTDTTDAYRLGRWARVRTDLGGFYFHLIFALGLVGLYLPTGWEFLLLVVLVIDMGIIYQCMPFVRFDGYWTLANLTGIPDFSRKWERF